MDGRPTTYEAIVWRGDDAGIRTSVLASGPRDAESILRAEYGDDAVISTWREEDAARPR